MLTIGHAPEIKRYIEGTAYIYKKLIVIIRDDGYFTTIRVSTQRYAIDYVSRFLPKTNIVLVK